MEIRRFIAPLTIGLFVGLGVMIGANQVGRGGDLLSPSEYLALEGVLYGSLAGILAFGVAQVLLVSQRVRAWASLSAGIILALFGLLVTSWNLMWDVPLLTFTLEGAWLWPLAIVPLILSYLSFKRRRRVRRASAKGELEAAE